MRRIALTLVATGIAGCVSLHSEHVLTGTPRAAFTGSVKVVMDGSPGPTDYDEVGIVSATGSGDSAALPAVLGALQGESAGLGCDAVLRVRYDRGVESATATGVCVRLR